MHFDEVCALPVWSYPQSAVQDGENDAVQDENPIQDVTYIHVAQRLCTHRTGLHV